MRLWKRLVEYYKMFGTVFTPFVLLLSFVEFLCISKTFFGADREESSAKLEPFKQIKIFSLSQTELDLMQINLNYITVLMGPFISFLFSRVTAILKHRSSI